ncbi:hypothetical protein CCHR01_02768 [Colletotrichum chrysophilum]|uniref:Uncharacterized protein n=1 Tax=Colletotrichum chrysophilum TaxID=1836956 RepID=A0AAD9AWE0_9PEZI|nr:hypothetical protein CCHR01_02768 [Colletotrichum chrysophilum]
MRLACLFLWNWAVCPAQRFAMASRREISERERISLWARAEAVRRPVARKELSFIAKEWMLEKE